MCKNLKKIETRFKKFPSFKIGMCTVYSTVYTLYTFCTLYTFLGQKNEKILSVLLSINSPTNNYFKMFYNTSNTLPLKMFKLF